MLYYSLKIVISAILIVVISEVAKRSTFFGALIASLPLTSILAIIWLYLDTKSLQKVSDLSYGILLIVIPSLLFFLIFPLLVRLGWNFWSSIGTSMLVTGVMYWGYSLFLMKIGVKV